jgi:hypothetical protein
MASLLTNDSGTPLPALLRAGAGYGFMLER